MTSHFASMKLLAILVIFYKSAHWNNSKRFLFLVIIYFYLAKAKIDAITLLNYLGLSILYNMLLKKLKSITLANTTFIKQQAINCKLIDICNNFKYCKNVISEKIGNIVKFRFVIIAL